LQDRLGPLEPPYRSRGEAQVGRLLDRYGIPYVYERPTSIYDRGGYRTWLPDFTLPSYNGLVVEYAGMPDVARYMAAVRHKKQVYRSSGIRALFLYPRDLTGPNWPEKVVRKIYQASRSAYRRRSMYRASRASGGYR